MTRKIWVLAIASVLVSVTLLDGQVCATDADGRKKIAVFLDGTPLDVQQQAVALSKSTVVHTLSCIHALAIELPDVGTAEALVFLLNYTVLGVHILVGVYDDLVVSVLLITPALPPPQQTYDWGLEHIRVDDAEDVNPLIRFALDHPEQTPLDDLERRGFQVYQDGRITAWSRCVRDEYAGWEGAVVITTKARGATNRVFSWETHVRA